jgi:hypothetical protein
MKKKSYKMVAKSLHKELGLSKEDIFINLVKVKKRTDYFGMVLHSTLNKK